MNKQPATGGPFPRTKDGYAEFLKTPFWKELSRRKMALNPRCEFPNCGLWACVAHHVFYRSDWFQAQTSDLLSVCELHHRHIHDIQPQPSIQTQDAAKAQWIADMDLRIEKRVKTTRRARKLAMKRLKRSGIDEDLNYRT